MIEQITLFDFEPANNNDNSHFIEETKSDKRSFAEETNVTLYKAEDKLTNKLYFGITDNFSSRVGNHMSGKHINKDFAEAILCRPEDFNFKEVSMFVDAGYCTRGTNSRSHAIESFAIALYDTLNEGYNRSYYFHHDFEDTVFWEGILTPELLPLYRNANLDKLNQNVKAFVFKPKSEKKRRKTRQDLVAKEIIRLRILELKDLNINMNKYTVELAGMCRSDLHRFLKGKLNFLSVKSSLRLVHLIEDTLGLAERFDFEAEYLKAKSRT